MLNASDKSKIEKHIDDVFAELSHNVKAYSNIGHLSSKQYIDNVVKATVNRVSPESKMLLNSVCNMLEAETLKKGIYNDSTIKAAYYELDIRSEFTKRFSFDVPQDVDYQAGEKKINALIAAGAIAITGGIVSIVAKSSIPVCIAVVVAGVMAFVLQKELCLSNQKTDEIANKYLDSVKRTLLSWIYSIEQYYDGRIAEFERSYSHE